MRNPRPDWDNPDVIARGKEPAHVPLQPYANARDALAGDKNRNNIFEWRLGF